MKKLSLILIGYSLLAFPCSLSAQVQIPTFFMLDTLASSQGQNCVDILTSDFDDLVLVQFSLNYDPAVWELDNIVLSDHLPGLHPSQFGTPPSTPAGNITWSWTDPDEEDPGESLPDSTALFSICFNLTGDCGFSKIRFSGDPLAIATEHANFPGVNLGAKFQDGVLSTLIEDITPDTAVCGGQGVQLLVEAPEAMAIEWSGDGLSCTDCSDPLANPPFGGGSFVVTVTDADGCQETAEVFIEVHEYLDFGLLLFSNSPVCEGNTLQFYANNPYPLDSIAWTGPGGFFSEVENPFVPDVTAGNGGIYQLFFQDDAGCEITQEVEVTVLEGPVITFLTTPNPDSFDNCEGEIDLIIDGGIPPYLFIWSNGMNGEDLVNVCTGSYSVTVTDSQGCEATAVIEVGTPLEITVASITDVSCYGACDGSIGLTITGGVPPYSYLWSTGSSDFPEITNLCAGTYGLTVADSHSNISINSFIIESPPQLYVDIIGTTNASCQGAYGGSIQVFIHGGTFPYETGPLNDLLPGTYTVTVTDGNGCTAISEPAAITDNPIYSISGDPFICAGEATQLEATAPNAVSVSWSPAAGLSDPNVLNPLASPAVTTTYQLSVTDAEGCEGQDSITVFVLPEDCIEEVFLDISTGQSGNWCSPLAAAANPIGFTITQAGCAGDSILEFSVDTAALCINFTGLAMGTDTICVEICSNLGDPCNTTNLIITVTDPLVWPGDQNNDGTANHFDLLPIGIAIDSTGPLRPDAGLAWTGQPGPPWPQSLAGGVNYQHIDSNGDGQITTDDTLAIVLNWGLEHNLLPPEDPEFLNPILNNGAPFYIQPDTIVEGAVMNLPIILGNDDNPAEDVYGLAFSLVFDPDIIVDGSALVDFSISWLGNINQDMIAVQREFASEGRVDVGLTRVDGMNLNGAGVIGHLIVTIEDDILLLSSPEIRRMAPTFFEVRDVRIINFQEEAIPVDPRSTFSEVITSLSDMEWQQQVTVFPNPARDQLHIFSGRTKLKSAELLTMDGRILIKKALYYQTRETLSLQNIPAGIYLLKLDSDNGMIPVKVSICH